MEESAAKGTWKDRLYYFWMYYKIPVFLIGAGLIVALSFIHAGVTKKTPYLNAMFFDIHTDADESSLEQDFAKYADIDSREYDISVSTSLMLSDSSSASYSMGSLARLYTQVGNEELDVCGMKEKDFEKYEKAGIFLDLSTVFSKEEMEEFPGLYEKDGKILGIYLNGCPKIEKIGGYSGSDAVIGIIQSSGHIDEAKTFLKYLNAE